MDSFFHFIFSQYQDYSPFLIFLELIASSFGLISVLLARRGSVWAFGVGLISTLCLFVMAMATIWRYVD